MAIPKQASVWDSRRNTSQVFQPSPVALRDALGALAGLRRSDPALVQWIVDGHPTLTAAEHLQRFGQPFRSTRSKRATGPRLAPPGALP